ncbi:hypothetical protein D1224_07135 [Henriciella barbarensis]|uniref:Uncharacterized protein n=1 Tax=Henriciella barbarensis TaxID=86342 RepID=A0A399R2R1_9PROT|nr:hypothetical protein [Henriciella barbarensis]RIJ24012.1 hypothetical protein D1224_07135 [Henriciella barbarensis]
MMDFISNNSSAISAGANVIMVIVWITYLQLMLNGIIRQRRSSLIVSSSLKSDAAARCFISNMSEGSFHIQNLTARIRKDDEDLLSDITEPAADNHERSFQIPLAHGEALELGSFEELLERFAVAHGKIDTSDTDRENPLEFTVTIVGIHGPSRKPVAARRRFGLYRDRGTLRARGLTRETEQFRWGPRRRRIVSANQVIN